MEFWDYAGGASFRAFVAEKGGEKSLFAFFDSGLVGQDLKQAYVLANLGLSSRTDYIVD